MRIQNCGRFLKRSQWLGGLALFLSLGLALGQNPSDVSLDELEKDYRKHRELLLKLTTGDQAASANDRSHMEAIDFSARYATYRFANVLFHKVGGSDDRKTMDRLYKDFDDDVTKLARNKEKTKEFARLLGLKIIEHGKKVLDTPLPLVQVNIARVLARSAGLGQPELADCLIEILADTRQNDAVKYYALRGLRDLAARTTFPSAFLGSDRDEKVAQALMTFIKRKVAISPITPPDEIEGLAVVRREAVRALAQLRNPGRSGKERPALVLLKVMAREGFNPPPREDERMEAALGLARMRPGPDRDYQPAYAAQQIALFLSDFANYYSTKYKEERRPTRVLAAQLLDALEALKTDTKDPYIAALFDANKPGSKLLERIVSEQVADPSELVTLVEATKLPASSLFKSLPDASVPGPRKN